MSSENTTGHLVDKLESCFQGCLESLVNQEHFNVQDSTETKADVENAITKFLDTAKQLECFFLQKRLRLSAQKPELLVKEDINELKIELIRKDALLQKHSQRIQQWKTMLAELQSQPRTQPPPPLQHPPVSHGQQLQSRQGMSPGSGGPMMMQGQGHPPVTAYQQYSQAQLQHGPPPGAAQRLDGPLAYLEQTAASVGMPDRR